MRKLLTDAFLRAVDPPASGRFEYADLRCPGLVFRVTDKGVMSWSFRFHDPEDPTRKLTRATIGRYPTVSLAGARSTVDAWRATVADGNNPLELQQRQRKEGASRLFGALADVYLATVKDPSSSRFKKSADQDEKNLQRHVLPKWSSRRYDQLARADIIEITKGLVAAGKPVLANRIQSLISGIFSFAIDEGLLTANPCSRLRKAGAEGVGSRVLTDPEIRLFWPSVVQSPLTRQSGLALRLCLLLGGRRAEIAGMRQDELTDLDHASNAIWTIPAARVKNGREHIVPLPALAVATIYSALDLIPTAEQFLFPSRLHDDRSIEPHSLSVCMTRLGEVIDGGDKAAVKTWRNDPPTTHDFRRTLVTRLSAMGFSREDRDAVVNHTPQGVGAKHYDKYERLAEKRIALEAWANAVDIILRGGPNRRLEAARGEM